MKNFFLLLIVVVFVSPLFAQQPAQYSQYMLNKYRFNPAFAGMDNSLSVTGVYRDQWVGLSGRPRTQNLTLHLPFYFLSGGIGINIESSLAGVEHNILVTGTYAYHIQLSRSSTLSVGVSGGFVQKSLDGALIRTPDGQYGPDPGGIEHADALLPRNKETAQAPHFDAGIFLKTERFEAGLSAQSLMEMEIPFSFNNGNDLNIKQKRTYFGYLAYVFDIGSIFTFKPCLLAKSDINQTQLEISGILTYSDNIFLGSSFRGYETNSLDAVVLLAGFKINEKITLSYSYDFTLSGLNQVSTGSHEIVVNYNLNKDIGKGIPEKIIYNPRFL